MNIDLGEAIRSPPSERRARLRQMLMAKGVDLSAIPIVQRPADLKAIPASFAQQRLWFLSRLDPHSTAYNVPSVVRMNGVLSVDALRQAFTEVVRRPDILRTTFASLDGKPVQVAAPPTVPTDLSRLNPSERDRQAGLLAQHEAEAPFDLATGPLLRARLLRLARTEHVLLLTAHHTVVDATSIAVLAHELTMLYEAYAEGQVITLPDCLRKDPAAETAAGATALEKSWAEQPPSRGPGRHLCVLPRLLE